MTHKEFGELACVIDFCGEDVEKKLPSYKEVALQGFRAQPGKQAEALLHM